MTDTLTQEELRTALAALPGWEAGVDGLERVVPAPEQDQATLTDALRAVASEATGEVRVTPSGAGLRITLGSPDESVGRHDVELATRIDRLLAGGVAWDKY